MLSATMSVEIEDLLAYIDASPTPYHAVAETARRLDAAGYSGLAEAERWELEAGERCYVVRGEGSLIAFEMGEAEPSEAGFRIIGAHSDSPNLRLKPAASADSEGYRRLALEPYGGVLLYTWLDRDLSLAGLVSVTSEEGLRSVLIDFERPLLRVPSLAIHLNREIREEGLKLNPQQHMNAIVGVDDGPELDRLILEELERIGMTGLDETNIAGFDLMTYDCQPSTVSGARGEFIHAPRLDNLASCHAALRALLSAGEGDPGEATRMIVLYDNEEVGSRSAHGAAGPFLADVIERISHSRSDDEEARPRALAQSSMVSADVAHAVHPNYADRHEPGHKPVIGKGPVIKSHINLAYASDGRTSALFASLCREVGITPQHFVCRADMLCGSTIGPVTAARVGIPVVDVGIPILSMHSSREMAGTADVEPMINVMAAYLERD